jgi:IclR family transcriptional regulator, KDG regulon repressor
MSIQVLDRAVKILDVLGENGVTPLTALSAKVGLPLSTASRIVGCLVAHGFVDQDGGTRAYRLGTRLLALGSRIHNQPRLLEVARPIMERLATKTGEDSGLSVLQGTYAVILDRVEGPNPLKIVEAMRQPVPLHCGAFRKVLLAYQPQAWIFKYLSSIKLTKYAPRTLTRKAAILQELAVIRSRGYALSYGEYLADSGGIASPVFDHRDELQAALFIWGPYSRLNEKTSSKLTPHVVDAAAELTRLLGGRPELESQVLKMKRRS